MNLICDLYHNYDIACPLSLCPCLSLCLGVDLSSIHTMKMQRRSTMMSDVKQLLAAGEGLSLSNEDGVTLVKAAPYVLLELFRLP